eukprot:681397-Hanusia_phi.AAC.2
MTSIFAPAKQYTCQDCQARRRIIPSSGLSNQLGTHPDLLPNSRDAAGRQHDAVERSWQGNAVDQGSRGGRWGRGPSREEVGGGEEGGGEDSGQAKVGELAREVVDEGGLVHQLDYLLARAVGGVDLDRQADVLVLDPPPAREEHPLESAGDACQGLRAACRRSPSPNWDVASPAGVDHEALDCAPYLVLHPIHLSWGHPDQPDPDQHKGGQVQRS